MVLLKNAIEFNNIDSLQSIFSSSFTYDTCEGVLNYDKFLENLRILSTPPLAISTDWSVRDAQLVNEAVHFKIHYNDQKPIAYADIDFEANVLANGYFGLTKGKSSAC
ncbi:unnamed protein product [Caenorhabditis sp. 36 PRJEB53466]|nr:unnamed protein product [Caenorhabditis sp. 36 PRJEB53466]